MPQRKAQTPALAAVHARVLQNALRRLDRAFASFFRRVRTGKKPGYPRFKGRGWYDSFTYPQWGNGARFLGRAHLKVARARKDFHHKTARRLVLRFDHLAVETLHIGGMLRHHPLANAIADAGWGTFLTILRAKAASAGRVGVGIHPAGTSQQCAACGARVPKRLAERWHTCPFCGSSCHRDHNAARNIWTKGGGTAFGEPLAVAGAENREPHA